MRDKDYNRPAAKTFAQELNSNFGKTLQNKRIITAQSYDSTIRIYSLDHNNFISSSRRSSTSDSTIKIYALDPEHKEEQAEQTDVIETYISSAIEAFKLDEIMIGKIKSNGQPWFGIQQRISQLLPDVIDEHERKFKIAFNIMPRVTAI